MMYRQRGKMFNVIRTTYNPEKGRGEQKIVCSFKAADIATLEFSNSHIQDQISKNELNCEEVEEFKKWFESTKEGVQKELNKKENENVCFWLKTGRDKINDEITEELADNIYIELKRIKNKLRELGYKEKRNLEI